jgi:hypothetical protein
VDLDTLGMILHGSAFGGGYVDPGTGEVIETFEGEVLAAERLTLALEGRGAFRRFRDTIHDQPEALIHPLR